MLHGYCVGVVCVCGKLWFNCSSPFLGICRRYGGARIQQNADSRLVVMFGQLGAIFGPLFFTPLGKKYFGNSGPTVIICGLLILAMMLGIYLFMKTTPKSEMVGYHSHDKGEAKDLEPGFLEGLSLCLESHILLGIFAVIGIYEIIITIIDFNFKFLVFN